MRALPDVTSDGHSLAPSGPSPMSAFAVSGRSDQGNPDPPPVTNRIVRSMPWWIILLLASAALDTITMLALPPGAERNPLAAAVPQMAVVFKVVVALGVAALMVRRVPRFRAIGAFAVMLWTFGAAANVLVLV